MKTRSQTLKAKSVSSEEVIIPKAVISSPTDIMPIYSVHIDFDEASDAWRANKQSIGNGSFKYVCSKFLLISNKRCGVKCAPESVEFCKRHYKKR